MEKVPVLVDLVKGLKEAKAKEVALEVTLTAQSPEGLDSFQMEMVRELLHQHGLDYQEESE